MVTITERAADRFEVLREFLEARRDQGVKLIPCCCKACVGMTIGGPSEGDEVVWCRGRPLLIVDCRVVQRLDGAVIDCEDVEQDGRQSVRFRIS